MRGFPKGHKISDETKKKISDAKRKGVYFECLFCEKKSYSCISHYLKKKRHFCSLKCYKEFVKTLPFYEQNRYKGVRKIGESKQVYHRNYCKKNPENMAHLKARGYARKKNADGSHTINEWIAIKNKHNNKCAKCGLEKRLTKDHIIPLSKGGSDYIGNIQPLCHNCNSKKWTHIYEHSHLLTEPLNK